MGVSGSTKRVVGTCDQANGLRLKVSGCDRITVMPVVSDDGTAWRPVVVVPGKRVRVRELQAGKKQTVANFLPSKSYMYMRHDVAGVDSDIFERWAKNFVIETRQLRTEHKHLLLIFDGYAGHLQYGALKTLADANIVTVALPAHTSHATQPLDVGVFSSVKKKYGQYSSQRTISSRRSMKHDMFTVAELITKAYDEGLTRANIKGGFRGTGIWPLNPEKVLSKHKLDA